MESLTLMYKILRALEKAMKLEEFDPAMIGPEALGVNQALWEKCLKLLVKDGYVDGVEFKEYISGACILRLDAAHITMRGLEYLEENGTMRKIANALKGIKDAVPFV